MKLELKHLAPYLPYGLQFTWEALFIKELQISELIMLGIKKGDEINTGCLKSHGIAYIRPLLIPLSEITEDIYSEQFFEDNSELLGDEHTPLAQAIFFLQNSNPLEHWFPYETWQLFFRHHFDIFGLINAGLALNKLDYIK